MTVAEKMKLDRELAALSDLEWRELRRRYGDLVLERPELALSLVDDVRRERVH